MFSRHRPDTAGCRFARQIAIHPPRFNQVIRTIRTTAGEAAFKKQFAYFAHCFLFPIHPHERAHRGRSRQSAGSINYRIAGSAALEPAYPNLARRRPDEAQRIRR